MLCCVVCCAVPCYREFFYSKNGRTDNTANFYSIGFLPAILDLSLIKQSYITYLKLFFYEKHYKLVY